MVLEVADFGLHFLPFSEYGNGIKLLEQKYGKNTIAIFRKWEKMEAKVSDFKNH